MAAAVKTVIATGGTSGIGFEVVKQLLESSQAYRFILGCRDTKRTEKAYSEIKYDTNANKLEYYPLELADLRTVNSFAKQALQSLGQTCIDYLLLNAGLNKSAKGPGPRGSKWNEQYIVNHLSQHYLIHLLRAKLEASRSRVIVVSSGAIRMVKETHTLDAKLKANIDFGEMEIYPASKLVQLLNAQYWRRHLAGRCDVIAVSPGLIGGTGLGRNMPDFDISKIPDAKTPSEGGRSVIEAFHRNDFPEDPRRIFLTSWGDWWEADIIKDSFDQQLQNKFSPSPAEIEREENVHDNASSL